MLIILLSWLINGILLSLIYAFGLGLINKHIIYTANECVLLGFTTTILLTVIGVTKLGNKMLRLLIRARNPINSEQQRITPLITDVIKKINQIKQTNYSLKDFNIMLLDINEFNAQSFGTNAIVLTSGLLKLATDDELKSIFTHEISHLYYKDSQILIAFIFSSFATSIVMFLYKIYFNLMRFINIIIAKSGNDGLNFLMLFSLIPVIIFSPIILLNWIIKSIFSMVFSFINRKYQYRADIFTKEIGYQNGLIKFLEKIQIISKYDNTLIGLIFATNPNPMKRIAKLEKSN